MYLILIIFAIAVSLFFLIQWVIQAPPAEIKKLLLFVSIIILLLLSIALFKFGGIIIAAIALAIPLVRKLYTVFSAYHYFRKIKTGRTLNQPPNVMDIKEAQEILGVNDQATEKEIKAAYHSLMQKNHPDQGGSEYFAKK